jgi:putative acetyltransferase
MKNNVQIREYKIDDAKSLAKIYYNTIHEICSKDYTKEQIEKWAPKSSLEIEGWIKKWKTIPPYVAVIDNKRVGFVEFESNGHIDCFYVHHQFQGKGIGGFLLQKIEMKARENSINKIYAEISISAKPFFIAKGFQVEKEQVVNYNGVNFINYRMSKLL